MDAAQWDARYQAGRQWSVGPNSHVVDLCAGLPVGSAVDLGAGEGRNAAWLAGLGWRVHAVDFSEVALARVGEAAGAAVTTEVADLLLWEPGDRRYDLVLICYVQLDAAGRARLLTTAATATAPGGRVVAVAHDLSNLDGGTGGPQDPGVLWTVEEAAALLTGARLRVKVAQVRRRPVDGAARVALDTVVVGQRAD